MSATYAGEAPLAFAGASVRVLAEELRARGEEASPRVRTAVNIEAQAHTLLFDTYAAGTPILAPEYELEGGAYDLGKPLAEVRAENQDLVDLKPDALQAAGIVGLEL